MTLVPNEHFRYAFKKGMSGWDVEALQIAINGSGLAQHLSADGSFGPLTEAAVKDLQGIFHITQDGIAGPETQGKICQRAASNAEAGKTPKGLLRGICEGESGNIIPCTTPLYTDGSRDYGPFQAHLHNPSQERLEVAYNPNKEAVSVATETRGRFDKYVKTVGTQSAWECAVLYHNWPAAAEQLAKSNTNWVYESEGKSYTLNDRAPWIEALGVPGVTTGMQWCKFYIEKKIIYVTSWTVS